MILKHKYILRTVADKTVAIATGCDDGADGVITLNDTGAFIFRCLNDGLSKADSAEAFFKEYDVTKEEAEKAVDSFVDSLSASGLLSE